LEAAGINVTVKKPNEAKDIDYFDYDLVCVGSPSIQWHPAKPMDDLLKHKLDSYRKQGKIKPSAPNISGKNALIFVTYSGPHTGLDEATNKDMKEHNSKKVTTIQKKFFCSLFSSHLTTSLQCS